MRSPDISKTRLRPERIEPNWAEIDVFYLHYNDRENAIDRAANIRDEVKTGNNYLKLVEDLLKRSDLSVTKEERRSLENFHRFLATYINTIRAELQTGSNDFSAWKNIGTATGKHPLIDGEIPYVGSNQDKLNKLGQVMEQVSRPYAISLSSSHITTAFLMRWLREQNTAMEQVGLVSFDHHTDVKSPSTEVYKDRVMSDSLATAGVGAVAVFGNYHRYQSYRGEAEWKNKLDVVSGKALYNAAGLPDVEIFDQNLRRIFSRWQQQGIKQIYTSVDLDGLRLVEQIYTASDYNPIDMIRGLVAKPDRFTLERLHAGAKKLSRENAQAVLKWLLKQMEVAGLANYYGIPASWIPRAMRQARESGMQLGVTKPNQMRSQKIVGDIVEYTPPDYNQRTARITKALLTSMLIAAQKSATLQE